MHSNQRTRKQKGVISVEFGLGAFALFLALFAVFEVGRFSYLVNLTDATLSESTRKVRIFEGEKLEVSYQKRLEEIIEDEESIWNGLGVISTDEFFFQISTFRSPNDFVSGTQELECERCPIVLYELSYEFKPVVFTQLFSPAVISRRILTIQEHEGWEDENS